MVTILTYSEKPELQLELAAAAYGIIEKLQGSVLGVFMGKDVRETAKSIANYFDKVLLVESELLGTFDAITYANALFKVVQLVNPDIILISGTRRDTSVASSLSALLNAGCVTDVINIEVNNNELVLTRGAYGGLSQSKLQIASSVKVIIVKPGIYKKTGGGRQGVIEELKIDIPKPRVELVNYKQRSMGAVNLNEAEVVVVAGRGVKKKEDLSMLEELAKLLNGVVSCTMPLSSELGWFPTWVGMSGVTIRPKLYIGVGVSGQVQHIAGIRDSKVIVAINIDPNAPIFEYADYGIVGDLYKVVPKLIEEFKRRGT